MAGMSTAKRAELEALRADLQQARGDIDFRSQAHLPPHGGHLSALDRAIAHVNAMLGEDDEETTAGTGTTQVATVPPGSAGGAAANPVTGATTNVPFSQPLAEGDASSIPGTPAYDPSAQAEVERDAAVRQHAAERADTGGGAGEEATVPTSDGDGDIVELREPAVPGLTEAQRQSLAAAGFRTADAIRGATDEQLLAVDGVGPKTVEALREATKA